MLFNGVHVIAVYVLPTALIVGCSTLDMRRRLFHCLMRLVCTMTTNLSVPIYLTVPHWPRHGNSAQVRSHRSLPILH